ncbi:UNVERIFIED_CONTAM: hypothetical protein RMT77_008634 [Armadillidium vulgare]
MIFLYFIKAQIYDFDVIMAFFVLSCFMICMVFSTMYHLFNCHSFHYCQIWLSWDIFGISAAFLAVFISGIYYGFWCSETFLPRILNMYVISGIAVLFYLLRIPESLFPGKFNYIGASHQLWHIFVLLGLFYWHQSGLIYAKYREEHGCAF